MAKRARAWRNWDTGIKSFREIPKQKKTRRSGPSQALWYEPVPTYNKMKRIATSDARRNWDTGISRHKKMGKPKPPRKMLEQPFI